MIWFGLQPDILPIRMRSLEKDLGRHQPLSASIVRSSNASNGLVDRLIVDFIDLAQIDVAPKQLHIFRQLSNCLTF